MQSRMNTWFHGTNHTYTVSLTHTYVYIHTQILPLSVNTPTAMNMELPTRSCMFWKV